MKCNQAYQNIVFEISNKEFEKHLSECLVCKEIYSKVNNTMSVLDHTIDVPEGLVKAILLKKGKLRTYKVRKRNLSGYIQLAAAIFTGIFMGYMLGKNANTRLSPNKHESIMKYYEMHHLNIDYSKFDFHSFKL